MRKFILGRNDFILSHTQFKRAILTGQLSIIAIIFCIGYLSYDLLLNVDGSWVFQSALGICAIISFLLNRAGRYSAAKILLGISANIVIFMFAITEPITLGVHVFFIVTSLGAWAAFGYEERGRALTLFIFSISLFLISFFVRLDLLPPAPETEGYLQFNLMANYLTALISSFLIIYFLVNVNHRTESSLRENEKKMVAQNEELIQLNAELDRFAYSSSHDLRAPLNSIIGLIGLSDKTDDPEELRTYRRMMKERISHLDQFIKDIADYSRNSRGALKFQSIHLRKFVRETLESLRFAEGADRIRVDLSIDDMLSIRSDSMRLQMILSNLISNAFRYHDPEKPEATLLIQASTPNLSQLIIVIKDNGLGIPKEHLDRIFDMFYQAHGQKTGSGLGLYIVKETIEKLGGEIQVESEVGVGSSFKVTLPLISNE